MNHEDLKKIISIPGMVEKIGEVNEWNEIEEGLNTIYVLKTSKREFILKVRTNERNELGWFRAEPLIYQKLESLEDVPSPEIVYSDVSQESCENAFFIMEKLEGVNPAGFKKEINLETLERIVNALGRFLGRIHDSLEFDAYGMLKGKNGELRSEDDVKKWTWHIEGSLKELESHIEEGWEEDLDLEFPSKKEIGEVLPEKPGPKLLHLDNRLDNLLIQDGCITAFLDWSHPEAGHNEYDLVRAEYLLIDYDLDFLSGEKKQVLRNSLYEGYEEVKGIDKEGFEDRRNLYRRITVVWLLAGFPNWKTKLEPEERMEMKDYLLKKADLELD